MAGFVGKLPCFLKGTGGRESQEMKTTRRSLQKTQFLLAEPKMATTTQCVQCPANDGSVGLLTTSPLNG